ncbi:FKBP-type peptidyl-prolyl cis-trans isomerase [Lactococcus insecticola]|uniref:Peptidyl-prolyl cis-trans isomerase n=1 Tax=Pseudolactococcus insecticola TaxID=2709158 RepID=A0A6A0B9R1_9LACT|nr:FKBP-type peptidyl-prolyl cis-trans isomerase [Lactococcus insecticola]GFH41178.1 hypothetical protein Hs20B_15760 [Lactococcus insecticola]
MENKNNNTLITIIVLVVTLATAGLVVLANQPKKAVTATTATTATATTASSSAAAPKYVVTTDLAKPEKFDAAKVTELKVETLKEGTGAVVKKTDTISANYNGWNASGTLFESTKQEGGKATPVEFALSSVIPGWTEGLTGKKVGGIYKLTIPTSKAYGSSAPSEEVSGPLVFVVEIVAVK